MSPTTLEYQQWIQDALRAVMRRALETVSEEGLPGEHHFNISFFTGWPGVELSPDLHRRYPEEMTIVLQYQFWDLQCDAEGFSVMLSFAGARQRIRVPYEAVTAFIDPAEPLALRFRPEDEEEEPEAELGPSPLSEAREETEVVDLQPARPMPATALAEAVVEADEDSVATLDEGREAAEGEQRGDSEPEDEPNDDGPLKDNVVPFDSFRKR